MEDPELSPSQLRLRLNALLRAYFYEEATVKGQPMTREEIIAEICAMRTALDATDKPVSHT